MLGMHSMGDILLEESSKRNFTTRYYMTITTCLAKMKIFILKLIKDFLKYFHYFHHRLTSGVSHLQKRTVFFSLKKSDQWIFALVTALLCLL